jgi:hypothetical protein
VHHDVQRPLAEVGHQPLGQPGHGEVAALGVALVRAHVLGRVGQRVVRGVERVDALELEARAVGQLARGVELAALEEVEEDAERGGPGGHGHRGARFGQRPGDGPAVAVVVGDAGDERAAAGEVDGEHGRER